MKAAKAANPDAFVAWSYPPDTFGLAEQAKIEGLDVKAYYRRWARRFRASAPSSASPPNTCWAPAASTLTPAVLSIYSATRKSPASTPITGAARSITRLLQMLEQSIEAVGSTDTKAVNDHIKSKTFETIAGTIDQRKQSNPWFWTVGQWKDGLFHGVKGVNTKGEVRSR